MLCGYRGSSALFFSDDARVRAADQMPLMLNARRAVKPGTHWQQCWLQHDRLCWKSTKSTVSTTTMLKLH